MKNFTNVNFKFLRFHNTKIHQHLNLVVFKNSPAQKKPTKIFFTQKFQKLNFWLTIPNPLIWAVSMTCDKCCVM